MIKVALVGNPNSGKTSVFNILTGSTAHVGNWPGVTVEKKVGVYKKEKELMSIIDLPGIYSLSPYTPEEMISRKYILEEHPDCIINVIDSTNLERNLYLTTQLMEINIPIVIALNMIDILEKRGDKIDCQVLQEKLGIPIVEVSAIKEKGLNFLMQSAYIASKTHRTASTVLNNDSILLHINEITTTLKKHNISNPLFNAIKLVENEENNLISFPEVNDKIEAFKSYYSHGIFDKDYESLIADNRYEFITKNCSNAITRQTENIGKLTNTNKIDRVLTNKWLGIPIFLSIIFFVFHFTFSENFLYLGTLISEDYVSFQGTIFEGVFGLGGVNSFGVVLQSLMTLATDSFTSLIGGLLSNSPAWLSGFICDGVLGGLSAVLSFIPQILLLLLFFSILEDSGYMARVAFLLDRVFRKFGISGRAFIPMIMGFGCSIPAIANTRTLSDDREKTATIRVIPFFCCGAKLPILTAIAGGIVMQFGTGNADIITYAMYLLGIITAIVSLLLMQLTAKSNDVSPFIMELPNYHLPRFKNLMLHLWDKAKHFIIKAFTIILASTIVIWFVSHFNFRFQFLEDSQINNSILALVGQLFLPIFTPLGFGYQLGNSMGWIFIVATVTGLIAKENVVATFGTLASSLVAGFTSSDEGYEAVQTIIQATGITIPALIAFIAFNMTTIPCFAAVATAKTELSSKKKFFTTILFWISTSYIVSMSVYLIGTWWWTSFIIFAIFSALVVVLFLKKNKRK